MNMIKKNLIQESPGVQQAKKRLLAAAQPHTIRYIWVKGHAGHPENERCDQLATTAADGDDLLKDIIREG